ncbi:hypothetical protein M5689_015530 [Euphorbia peplus]|nr:hypothetical protein M5689_015530 [Euphorbia peplus]
MLKIFDMAKSLHSTFVIALLLILVVASHCKLLETDRLKPLISKQSKISLEENIQKFHCHTNSDCKSVCKKGTKRFLCLKDTGICLCSD